MKSVLKDLLGRGGTLAVLCACALLAVGNAHAGGTVAGTSIGNTATLSYSVGAVAQTPIGSSPTGNTSGVGTATTFVVDNKVNMNVTTNDSTPVSAVGGQTTVTTTFVVTNTGNSTQDFSLVAANRASATTITMSTVVYTDNFDSTACTTSVNGVAQNFIGSLAPDATQTVLVGCSIPLGQLNGDVSIVSLAATARAPGSGGLTALVQTPGANNPSVVDIVFADGAGTDDAATDAAFSARSAYRVATAALTMSKTLAALCDPFNGGTNPKNIPGAYVAYTITITNNGGASATLGQITDALNANLTFDPDLIAGTGVAANCATGVAPQSGAGKGFKVTYPGRPVGNYPKYLTSTNGDGDGGSFAASTVTIDFGIALPAEAGFAAGELKVGDTATVVFNVKIN